MRRTPERKKISEKSQPVQGQKSSITEKIACAATLLSKGPMSLLQLQTNKTISFRRLHFLKICFLSLHPAITSRLKSFSSQGSQKHSLPLFQDAINVIPGKNETQFPRGKRKQHNKGKASTTKSCRFKNSIINTFVTRCGRAGGISSCRRTLFTSCK